MTTSIVKLLLLATASITAAVSIDAAANIDAAVNIDAAASINASANIDVDVDIFVEAVRIEDLAEQCQVPADAMVNLLNTDDFTTIDVKAWTAILHQPAEIVEAWPAPIKQLVFAEISIELSALVVPEAARRDLAPAVVNNKLEARNGFDTVRRVERQLFATHDARLKSAHSSCFQNVPCGTCVTAAGLTGFGAIAGCVGVAFAAVELTAGVATPVAISELVACGSKAAAVTVAAIGVCHSSL